MKSAKREQHAEKTEMFAGKSAFFRLLLWYNTV